MVNLDNIFGTFVQMDSSTGLIYLQNQNQIQHKRLGLDSECFSVQGYNGIESCRKLTKMSSHAIRGVSCDISSTYSDFKIYGESGTCVEKKSTFFSNCL